MAALAQVRRTATGLLAAAVAVFLFAVYVGLVFYENTFRLGAGAIGAMDLAYWFIIFAILLVLVLVALLILYFMPARADAAEGVEEEIETPSEILPSSAMQGTDAIDLTPSAPLDALVEALLVRCSSCATDFELPYSTQRPLHGVCPSCGQEAVLDEGEDVLHPRGQPAIDIEGIGELQAERLRSSGITTTEQLRAASAERIAAQTDIPQGQVERWQAMADLLRLKGIGKQYAELLVDAGIRSAADLKRETPARLVSKVQAYLDSVDNPPTKGGFNEKLARKFIDAARKGRLDAGL